MGIRIFLDRNLRKTQNLCVLETDSHASVRGRTESSAPTKQNKNHAKRDVEDGVPYEEAYGDTAVRCGRNQLGGGA